MSKQPLFKPGDRVRLKQHYSKYAGESGFITGYVPGTKSYLMVIDSIDPARPFEWSAVPGALELIDQKETFEPGEFESIFDCD